MARFSDPQIRAICVSPSKPRVISMPGNEEVEVGIRLLGEEEYDHCRIEGMRKIHELAKARKWDPVQTADMDPTLLERFIEREVVVRAYLDSETLHMENPVPFFSSVKDLNLLGSVAVADLVAAYQEHQEWSNPTLSLDEEGVEELCQELGKGRAFGGSLEAIAPTTLRRCLISLALRLEASRIGKSSTS